MKPEGLYHNMHFKIWESQKRFLIYLAPTFHKSIANLILPLVFLSSKVNKYIFGNYFVTMSSEAFFHNLNSDTKTHSSVCEFIYMLIIRFSNEEIKIFGLRGKPIVNWASNRN